MPLLRASCALLPLEWLDDDDSDKRLATIEQLRTAVRRGGGELPVHNLTQLFQLLSERLKDDDVDVELMSLASSSISFIEFNAWLHRFYQMSWFFWQIF